MVRKCSVAIRVPKHLHVTVLAEEENATEL